MFLILKRFMLAVGASFLVSGLVNAKTSIGGGVLSLNGAISTATCNVTVSMSSLPLPALKPTDIFDAAVNEELVTQTLALNVKECGFLGDYLYVTANRDTPPPLGTAGGSSSAGFTYSGSSITDTETAPLYYKVFITGANGSINLEGLPSSLDLRGITNKDNFTLPMDISIHKAPRSHVHPSLYTGNYTGNFTYSITYQ